LPELLPEYEASVGFIFKLLRSFEDQWEGDPKKIAQVLVRLSQSEEVPTRLILGADAEKRVQQTEAARAAEAEKWHDVTVSTVFADAPVLPELVNR